MKAFDFMNTPGIYIEIGQSSLKVLDGHDGLELSLERLENGRLDPLCAERLTSSLRVFLKKHNWRPRLRAFCAIGARGVSLRRLTVPLSSKDELQRLLLFQIEREFPLPPDELAWGYRKLNASSPGLGAAVSPSDGERNGVRGVQEVLVVAVKKEALQEYSELLSGCGLSPVFTSGALARSSLCLQPPGSYAMLEIGRSHSELLCFDNGDPRSIRILPWGGENITHAIETKLAISHAEAEKLKIHFEEAGSNVDLGEKIQAAIEEELNLLAGSIQTNWVGPKLYLTGGSARLKDIAPLLARSMAGSVECQRLEIMPGEGRSAAILGLKKSCEEEGAVPPLILQLKTSKDEGIGRPVQWKWAALACLLAIASISLRYAEAFVQKPRLSRKLSEIKAYREKLPKIDRELSFLQFLKTNQPPYLDPLFAMASAAPPGTRIESLSMNRRGDLSLRAAMRDSQQVGEFRSKLIDSGLFSTVVVEEQTPTPDRQKVTVRMTGEWKQSGDGKPFPGERRRQELEKSKTPAREVKPESVENAGKPAPPPLPMPMPMPSPRKETKE